MELPRGKSRLGENLAVDFFFPVSGGVSGWLLEGVDTLVEVGVFLNAIEGSVKTILVCNPAPSGDVDMEAGRK